MVKHRHRYAAVGTAALALMVGCPATLSAQEKIDTLGATPPPAAQPSIPPQLPYQPAPVDPSHNWAPPPASAAPRPQASPEQDRAAADFAARLPLSAAEQAQHDTVPTDPARLAHELGLRRPHGVRIPISPNPTAEELVHALTH